MIIPSERLLVSPPISVFFGIGRGRRGGASTSPKGGEGKTADPNKFILTTLTLIDPPVGKFAVFVKTKYLFVCPGTGQMTTG
jgi:hypothetical protein